MSNNHKCNCERDARRESFAAEPSDAADPLGLRRGLKGSWIRAVLGMASQRMARRTMGLAVLLVVGLAASEARAQPGPPPMMGGPPLGGMMGPPRTGPGMGIGGRPGPSPIPRGAGGAPGFAGNRPPLGSSPAGVAPNRPVPGRSVPGFAGRGPADLGRVGAGARPELGRAVNPRHASWYRGGWANSQVGTAINSINSRNASWYNGTWANSRGGTWDTGRASAAWDKARDYVREQRAWDYAAGLAWGLGGSGSSGYGSGHGSGSGYGSSSYGTGTDYGYGYGYGSGTGSGDAPANTSSDASSTGSDSSRTDAAHETRSDGQQDASAEDRGYQAFDRARDAFKAGDYAAALDLTDEALKDVPDDPLVHEFKALVLFARGEDARAAAELHAVLAVGPGMDWKTLIGLYPDVETYTGQLRALEDRCRQDAMAAAPRFVLAYHYLAAGHNDAAVAQLKEALALEPGDRVARRVLGALTGPPPASPGPTRNVPASDGADGRPTAVDLIGRWRAERDGSTYDLSLDDRSRFRWQAVRQGKPVATVAGPYTLSGDTLTFEPGDRPPLRASLTERSPGSFRFHAVGDPPGDPGLGFRRAAGPSEPDRDQRGGLRENR